MQFNAKKSKSELKTFPFDIGKKVFQIFEFLFITNMARSMRRYYFEFDIVFINEIGWICGCIFVMFE